MQVWTEKDSAICKCQYSEKELVKAIGDYKFNKTNATWVFPLRRLVDIIDNLKIIFSEETRIIYDKLRKERQEYHEKINLADKIKSNLCQVDHLDGVDLSMCYQHQKKAISLAAMFGSYALFMEQGTGKSICAIKLIEYWKVPAMIIAPLSTLESVWVKEIEKWSQLNFVILWRNLKEFNNEYDIYLINYEQFRIMHENKISLEDKIKCLMIDESAKLKTHNSKISKAVLSYKDKIPYRLVLSGVPAPNDLLEYHTQMNFVNSEILGDNYFRYRNTFFYSWGYGGYQFKPMKGAKEAIIENVSKQAFSIQKIDCLDLPDKVFEIRYSYMDEVQRKAYEMMKKENILEFKDSTTLAANELAKIMKLRQVTSGASINIKGIPIWISDTKVNTLKELLEEIPEDKQVIVWLNFHFEIHKLKEEFKETACMLYGEMSQKEKNKSIEDFQNGKYRLLLAHPLSGGFGVNFQQCCSYVIWFSLSYSSEQHSQANDRIYRIGQKNKCTYFYIMAKDSIDETIYKVLTQKTNLFEECLVMLKREKNAR